jgi:hypothetical protein
MEIRIGGIYYCPRDKDRIQVVKANAENVTFNVVDPGTLWGWNTSETRQHSLSTFSKYYKLDEVSAVKGILSLYSSQDQENPYQDQPDMENPED